MLWHAAPEVRLIVEVGFPAQSMSASELAALLAAEREGEPFLAYRDQLGDLRIVALSADRVRIGRTADNDIVLAGDLEVSRAHARLEAEGAGWTLVDDGLSRNGTYVNGEVVPRRLRLEDRDVIALGQTSMLFRHPSVVGDESTAVATKGDFEVRLTPAERRVLVALCRPLLETGVTAAPASNQAIADQLILSLAGVKSHVQTLFAKLGFDGAPRALKRTQLAQSAVERGLVTARDL